MQVLKIDIFWSFRWSRAHLPKDGTMDAVHGNDAQPISGSTILEANINYRRQVHGRDFGGQYAHCVNSLSVVSNAFYGCEDASMGH